MYEIWKKNNLIFVSTRYVDSCFFFPLRCLCLSSGGSMRRYVKRHCRFNHQPWIPFRVWQQLGLYVVNPLWTRGHYSSGLQWFLVGGQVWLPGNQRNRSTEHMVRYISYTDQGFELMCLKASEAFLKSAGVIYHVASRMIMNLWHLRGEQQRHENTYNSDTVALFCQSGRDTI